MTINAEYPIVEITQDKTIPLRLNNLIGIIGQKQTGKSWMGIHLISQLINSGCQVTIFTSNGKIYPNTESILLDFTILDLFKVILQEVQIKTKDYQNVFFIDGLTKNYEKLSTQEKLEFIDVVTKIKKILKFSHVSIIFTDIRTDVSIYNMFCNDTILYLNEDYYQNKKEDKLYFINNDFINMKTIKWDIDKPIFDVEKHYKTLKFFNIQDNEL